MVFLRMFLHHFLIIDFVLVSVFGLVAFEFWNRFGILLDFLDALFLGGDGLGFFVGFVGCF